MKKTCNVITASVQSTMECNVFTLSVHRGWGIPVSGPRFLPNFWSYVLSEGRYLSQVPSSFPRFWSQVLSGEGGYLGQVPSSFPRLWSQVISGGGTQSLFPCPFQGLPPSQDRGTAPPPPPPTGYAAGGTPRAVSRRKTFLFSECIYHLILFFHRMWFQ